MTLQAAILKLKVAGYQIRPAEDVSGLYELRRPDGSSLPELTVNQVIGLARDLQKTSEVEADG